MINTQTEKAATGEIGMPICDFAEIYAAQNSIRLHMPGHKGVSDESFISRLNAYDITEIEGADYLYEPSGIIKQSEIIAAKVMGVPYTFYSTEGSTLCIKAMLALACKPGGKVIALTNAHRAFSDGCKLLGLTPVWIEDIKALPAALAGYPEAAAVYLTSPDYLGEMIDIRETAKLVKEEYGRTLLHDCAHGAYLFLTDKKAYTDGADLICCSAHKTLPCLTGGAYLHVKNEAFAQKAAAAMKPFASTSPSYLTLCSLDYLNKIAASKEFLTGLAETIKKTEHLKKTFSIDTEEPLKICFKPGDGYREILAKYKIVPELINDNLIVLMFSPKNSERDFAAVYKVLSEMKISPAERKQKIQFIYTE
ncbi:MAG: aminotransferase class I/II-fold pyridoxal phosphate-dependent enzyme [Ruminococcus sp.]|jgi:arginine/lysine/ornithine decarboxylase|nr:aminotransferase class I/II-fold pyridoxal phosphate-dependent enzyme [Ruminococcus sp.]